MSEPELKPCPFCGEAAIEVMPSEQEHADGCNPSVMCVNCLVPVERSIMFDAITAWNTRMSEWQPISTAPKDTMLLLSMEKPNPFSGDCVKVGYKDTGAPMWTIFGASWTPTHWQPLPPPPQEEI